MRKLVRYPAGKPRLLLEILVGALVFALLFVMSRYDYLLFHSIAEIFSSVIAMTIFIIAWHTRRHLDNDFLLFLGIAFLFIGAIDLLHMLAYKGMGVFDGYDTDLPTQLWIAARYMQALSLLLAPLFLTRKLKVQAAFIIYSVVTALLLLSVFTFRIFPACFVEGEGLTAFKQVSEYIISLILLLAIGMFVRKRDELNTKVFGLLVASMAITIVSELSFTLYVDPYGFFNLFGHFLKIFAFYLVYVAIIETGLEKPYEMLYRKLKQREEMLEDSESRYRELFDNMKTGVAVYGAVDDGKDFVFLELNSAAERIERLKRDDVIGKRANAVFPCMNDCGLLDMIREVWEHNQSGYFPEIHCNRDGHEQWKDFFVYKLPSGEVVVVYEDVSMRKFADNVLSRYREQLEEQVQERTHELIEANEKLNLEVAERKKKARELRVTAEKLRMLSSHLQTVREEERRRIALEVHDDLGQELTVFKMNLKALEKRGREDERFKERVQDLSKAIDGIIHSVRKIASELRPAVLDDLGLDAALEWQMQVFSEKSGIESGFSTQVDSDAIDSDLATALFRISQEALTNVARHSGASRVEVRLFSQGEGLIMTVKDNGRGIMEKELTGTSSLGLLGMKERASAFGGEVEINGVKGEGTTITVRIPFATTHESLIVSDYLEE